MEISMNKITIGLDNGSTASMAVIGNRNGPLFDTVPTKDYLMGKAGKVIKRIDVDELCLMLTPFLEGGCEVRAYVEKPFTGQSFMVNTMVLAARSHEAVLIAMERLGVGVETVSSKEWQVPILGNVKGSPALKHASMLRGMALYPQFRDQIKKHGDADGLLMAHHFHHHA